MEVSQSVGHLAYVLYGSAHSLKEAQRRNEGPIYIVFYSAPPSTRIKGIGAHPRKVITTSSEFITVASIHPVPIFSTDRFIDLTLASPRDCTRHRRTRLYDTRNDRSHGIAFLAVDRLNSDNQCTGGVLPR